MVTATKKAPTRTLKDCPHCGNGFQALHLHQDRCPSKPAVTTPLTLASPPLGTPSPEAMLGALHRNKMIETAEDGHLLIRNAPNRGESMTVTHKTAGKVTLYKPVTNTKGAVLSWRRVSVKSTDFDACILQGWRATCGSCNGYCGNEPNDCPARPKRQYRICPICHVRVYDQVDDQGDMPVTDDPLAIQDTTFMVTTAEMRTRVLLETHIRTWHPQEGLAYGIQPLAPATLKPAALPVLGGVA